MQLTTEQAQAALGRVLDTIRATTDPDTLLTLAEAVQALTSKLTTEQAQVALGRVLDAMRGITTSFGAEALAQAVEALAPKLTTEQAQVAVRPILDAIRAIKVTTTNPDKHPDAQEWLAQAVQALASKLTTEQAQAALGRVLNAMRGTTDPYALQLLAQAVQALPVQLTTEQAQAAHRAILNAMRRSPTGPDTLAQAVQTLAPKLVVEAQGDMQRLARFGLGAAGSHTVAIAWAKVLEALLPPSPASGYAGTIVEVLKYPSTTLRKGE